MINLVLIKLHAMETNESTPQLVEKEQIPFLPFKNIIIADKNPELEKQLEQAVTLGNAHHSKVSIVFTDDDGLKRVETTIWAKGDKFICLKGGIWLPIARIIAVNI